MRLSGALLFAVGAVVALGGYVDGLALAVVGWALFLGSFAKRYRGRR